MERFRSALALHQRLFESLDCVALTLVRILIVGLDALELRSELLLELVGLSGSRFPECVHCAGGVFFGFVDQNLTLLLSLFVELLDVFFDTFETCLQCVVDSCAFGVKALNFSSHRLCRIRMLLVHISNPLVNVGPVGYWICVRLRPGNEIRCQ